MNNLEIKILNIFNRFSQFGFSEIFQKVETEEYSEITVKRAIANLVDGGYLVMTGGGRSIKYNLSPKGLLHRKYDAVEYLKLSEKDRGEEILFNFDFFNMINFELFTNEEIEKLENATKKFLKNKIEGSETIHKKELERFVIELSWKSSKIEGNTYTLLDTELLIKEGLKSNKNTESETKMILNHKRAFDFIWENKDYFKNLSLRKIEEVHNILTEDLGIKRGLRKSPVGVTGTIYKPIDNEFQIKEAIESMVSKINSLESIFEKSILSILCISHIQPFEDANKRTSRLVSNAILIAGGLAPLSYRNVDEALYRAACLVFYEQNSIEAFKQIFIEQYIFSCNTYNLG
jgi:Fic family protein